jgi:hypothetical protein
MLLAGDVVMYTAGALPCLAVGGVMAEAIARGTCIAAITNEHCCPAAHSCADKTK